MGMLDELPLLPARDKPRIGSRYNDQPGTTRVLEWTGEAWTPVCPTDDVAMKIRDAEGWLVCHICGVRAADARRAR
jgi:hypothetical protein